MALPSAALLVALLHRPSVDVLTQIFLFFTKAGTFVFGSGLAIVRYLHGGVVEQYYWLTDAHLMPWPRPQPRRWHRLAVAYSVRPLVGFCTDSTIAKDTFALPFL